MTDDPRKPVAGDPLSADGPKEQEPDRDAFGNPRPAGAAASRPEDLPPPPPAAPPPIGAPGRPAPTAPPPGVPPGAPAPETLPGTPPGYGPPQGYPPPSVPALPGTPGIYGGHVLAEWAPRLAAAGLNLILRALLFVPAIAAFIAGSEVAGVVLALLAALGAVLYAPVFMMRRGKHNGQSPGKQLMGIRVVRLSGEPMGFGWSVLREFVLKGLVFDSLGGVFLLPTALNYLWPLWDEQNRALHDMVLGTRVVQA